MFNGLRDEIVKLNKDVGNIANCEKAKKLRKKLLQIGLPLAIVGGIGIFVCFILFATLSFGASFDSISRSLIPFFLMIPCMLITAVGANLTKIGLSIVITGYVSNVADEVVGNNCPNCNTAIEDGVMFCSKCGTALKKICPSCSTENSIKSQFCKNCGKEL